jgi:C4-dicarboxylate transporter DctM subunit
MDPLTIGWICILAMFVLLPTGIPIAFIMLAVGVGGYVAMEGVSPTLGMLRMVPFSEVATYSFTVIPLFILMGHVAHFSGLAAVLLRVTRDWMGRIPGGLVHATIAGCAAFGAMCGSGLASCATMSKVAIPEMIRLGVDMRLAYGAVAAAGTRAAMIPPSIIMVVYGIITEQSIGRLLIAGILPGILATVNFMIMVYVRAKRNPQIAPIVTGITWQARLTSLKPVWAIVLVIFVIIGGIYSGAFTPTEAGAVGTFTILILGFAQRRLTWGGLKDSAISTIKTTGMIFLILIAAFIFTRMLNVTGVTTQIVTGISSLDVPPLVVLIGIMLLYIFIGTFMDFLPALFMTLPVVFPIILRLGYDPIWFGVLIVHLDEMSLITPPFGLNLFVMKGVIPEANVSDIIKGVFPFIVVDFVTLAIYIAFPQIALFLPSLMPR